MSSLRLNSGVEAFARARRARLALPRNVRALSWVSFANDAASELAYPIVPLFLTVTLGAPVAAVGLIEGVAEGIAVGLRGLSGWLSDRWGERRLPWVGAGYAGSAAGRVLLAAAPAWGWVLGGRVVDRLGKGARTAPRDALIRDSTPPPLLGAAFGYHRALDTAGAVVGPLAAVVLLAGGFSFRSVLWVAVLPGFVALLLLRAVREAPRATTRSAVEAERMPLPRGFWLVLATWVVFSLGNSSDVFLLLRAKELGLGTTLVVLAYALYNVVYAGLSWPLGALSDRRRRELVLGGGLLVFGLVYLGFALAPGAWAVWPLFAVYGSYVAATEGVAKAWVADQVPGRAIGTAYGIFSAASGGALLLASVAAGLLWSHVSPAAPFVLGAGAAGLALLLVVLSSPRTGRGPSPPAAPPPP
jgi:MFS family permease